MIIYSDLSDTLETKLQTTVWLLQKPGGIFSYNGVEWLPRIDHDIIYTPKPIRRPT